MEIGVNLSGDRRREPCEPAGVSKVSALWELGGWCVSWPWLLVTWPHSSYHEPSIAMVTAARAQVPGADLVTIWSHSGGTRIKGVFGRNYQNIKRFGNQELESQIRISKLFSTQNTRSIINKYWPLFGSHWQQLPSSSHFYKARSMAQNVICNRDRAE